MFPGSGTDGGPRYVVLCCQGYIVAFHTAGAVVHRQLGHHPTAAVGPGVFVLLGFLVAWLRAGLVTAALGTVLCAALGTLLSSCWVRRKDSARLLDGTAG